MTTATITAPTPLALDLADAIAGLPLRPWGMPWRERVARLLDPALTRLAAEARRAVIDDVLLVCAQIAAESEAQAERCNGAPPAQERKQVCYGKAIGARAVAAAIRERLSVGTTNQEAAKCVSKGS